MKNDLYINIKRLRAVHCCGNKLNFLEAKTIQYSSLSPIMYPNWNKADFFLEKTDPKLGMFGEPNFFAMQMRIKCSVRADLG